MYKGEYDDIPSAEEQWQMIVEEVLDKVLNAYLEQLCADSEAHLYDVECRVVCVVYDIYSLNGLAMPEEIRILIEGDVRH